MIPVRRLDSLSDIVNDIRLQIALIATKRVIVFTFGAQGGIRTLTL